jgi:hypothetical protein
MILHLLAAAYELRAMLSAMCCRLQCGLAVARQPWCLAGCSLHAVVLLGFALIYSVLLCCGCMRFQIESAQGLEVALLLEVVCPAWECSAFGGVLAYLLCF